MGRKTLTQSTSQVDEEWMRPLDDESFEFTSVLCRCWLDERKTILFINKNSSGDEIANVNFYAVRPEATRIRYNNQNNGHYAVQGHSRSPISVPIESSYTISY